MIKPIGPDEIAQAKHSTLPDAVVEVFNRLIAAGWDGRRSVVKQADAVTAISSALDTPARVVYDKGWLDVEPVYEAAGWAVDYDKPGYNEDYSATFNFTRAKP